MNVLWTILIVAPSVAKNRLKSLNERRITAIRCIPDLGWITFIQTLQAFALTLLDFDDRTALCRRASGGAINRSWLLCTNIPSSPRRDKAKLARIVNRPA